MTISYEHTGVYIGFLSVYEWSIQSHIWHVYALVNWTSLVHMMIYRLFGAKPLIELMLDYRPACIGPMNLELSLDLKIIACLLHKECNKNMHDIHRGGNLVISLECKVNRIFESRQWTLDIRIYNVWNQTLDVAIFFLSQCANSLRPNNLGPSEALWRHGTWVTF